MAILEPEKEQMMDKKLLNCWYINIYVNLLFFFTMVQS